MQSKEYYQSNYCCIIHFKNIFYLCCKWGLAPLFPTGLTKNIKSFSKVKIENIRRSAGKAPKNSQRCFSAIFSIVPNLNQHSNTVEIIVWFCVSVCECLSLYLCLRAAEGVLSLHEQMLWCYFCLNLKATVEHTLTHIANWWPTVSHIVGRKLGWFSGCIGGVAQWWRDFFLSTSIFFYLNFSKKWLTFYSTTITHYVGYTTQQYIISFTSTGYNIKMFRAR